MNNPVRTFYDLELKPIANATKNKIVEVAIELFSKNGFNGASVRDITKEVGIKESSLYKHFNNKDEILETIFINFRKETEKVLPPMEHVDWIGANMSLSAFLYKGFENFKAHIDDPINQKTWRIVYIELFRHPMAKELYLEGVLKRTVDCLAVVFDKMIEHKKMKPLDTRVMARAYQYPLFTMILEYNMSLAEGRSTQNLEKQISDHIEFFISVVCP